ncbi:MAG TPA: lytic transglycosylase domain-containing protein [Vicinamibacteria bacterium]|nr:lytic transglycosylase domain-containing protein [Vicinamibacteria bacterium]
MALNHRRQSDRREHFPLAANGPASRTARERRVARRRRLAKGGIAVALALMCRHTGRLLLEEDESRVEVEAGNFRIAPYERRDLETVIEEAAARHGVSPHLVRAVVQAESAFDPLAVSRVGAQGLMQLMPATATRMGVTDSLDPRQNVFGGAKYLSQLLTRFDGNVALALAGYNAGPAKVARYRGIPPYGETRGYVTKIRAMVGEETGVFFPLPARPALRSAHTRAHARRTRAGHLAPRLHRPRSSRRG